MITGTGAGFSAGADISGEDAHEHFDVTALDRANRMVRAIVGLRQAGASRRSTGSPPASAAPRPWPATWSSRPTSASFLLAFARIGLMPDGGASRDGRRLDRAGARDADGPARRAAVARKRTSRLVAHICRDDAASSADAWSQPTPPARPSTCATKRASTPPRWRLDRPRARATGQTICSHPDVARAYSPSGSAQPSSAATVEVLPDRSPITVVAAVRAERQNGLVSGPWNA